MNRSTFSLVLVTVVAVWIVSASGQAPVKQEGFLSAFKTDQPVILKEVAGRFEISLMNDALEPLTHTVISVEHDFLIVEDIAAVSEIRIPVFSIKSITTLKPSKN